MSENNPWNLEWEDNDNYQKVPSTSLTQKPQIHKSKASGARFVWQPGPNSKKSVKSYKIIKNNIKNNGCTAHNGGFCERVDCSFGSVEQILDKDDEGNQGDEFANVFTTTTTTNNNNTELLNSMEDVNNDEYSSFIYTMPDSSENTNFLVCTGAMMIEWFKSIGRTIHIDYFSGMLNEDSILLESRNGMDFSFSLFSKQSSHSKSE